MLLKTGRVHITSAISEYLCFSHLFLEKIGPEIDSIYLFVFRTENFVFGWKGNKSLTHFILKNTV